MYSRLLALILATGLSLAAADPQSLRFSTTGTTVKGVWSADVAVSPAAWKPGTQVTVNATLEIANRVTGAPQIGDVVHLTFFSRESAGDGTPYYTHTRVILRGTQIVWAK